MTDSISYIPTIDVAPLYSENAEAIAAVDQQIGDACKTAGAFITTNIPKPVRPDPEQTKKLLAFYNLPLDERIKVGTRRVNPNSPHDYRGYSNNGDDGWIRTEIYDIGPDYDVTVPDLPKAGQLVEPNLWPEQEPEAGWRAEMERYYNDMHDFGKRMIQSIIRYLGANESAGAARFKKSNSTLRLLNYPQLPADQKMKEDPELMREFNGEQMRLMIVEHKDQCVLSMLWQSDAGGLQMQTPTGEWQAIPRVEDGISVHLGMAIHSMTNGLFQATPHRVLGKGGSRQSIGFFLEPNLHSSVKPFVIDEVEPAAADEDSYAAALLKVFAEREANKKKKG